MIAAAIRPEIVMDFFHDAGLMARARLIAEGYTIAASESAEKVCIKYFNAVHQRIDVKARAVLFASDFHCPPDRQPGLEEIQRKSLNGEDLRPHQSERVDKLKFNDALFNDWGIHHFHLNTAIQKNGFIVRSGPVLFARVTDDTLYCITVAEHGTWSDLQMLEILHRDWPDSIAEFRTKGVAPELVTDEQIQNLRDTGGNVSPALADGTGYTAIGGGYMISGLSFRVLESCDDLRRYCTAIEDEVRAQFLAGLERPCPEGFEIKKRYQLRLENINGNTSAVDVEDGSSINIEPAVDLPPL